MSDTALQADGLHDAFLLEEVVGGGWLPSRHSPSLVTVIVAK